VKKKYNTPTAQANAGLLGVRHQSSAKKSCQPVTALVIIVLALKV